MSKIMEAALCKNKLNISIKKVLIGPRNNPITLIALPEVYYSTIRAKLKKSARNRRF